MKEFDENDAVKAMAAVLTPDRRDEDAVFEVLDLIFEFFEQNGLTDIDLSDDDDDEVSNDEIVAFVAHQLKKRPASTDFTEEEIRALVDAETEYEETLG